MRWQKKVDSLVFANVVFIFLVFCHRSSGRIYDAYDCLRKNKYMASDVWYVFNTENFIESDSLSIYVYMFWLQWYFSLYFGGIVYFVGVAGPFER